MGVAQPQASAGQLRFAILLAALLRLLYSLLGVVLAPHLRLDPALIQSNDLTESLMQRSEGLLYGLLGVWERFDTLWYLEIAAHGYERPAAVVFYPLYPLLIRLLAPVAGGALPAALVVSTLASVLTFWGLQRLLALDLPADAVRRASVLLAVWPGSFVFFAGYPESLVLALVVWSIWFARRERWWIAGAVGLMAGLGKAVGFLVVVPLAVLAWQARSRRAAPAALSLAAPVIYALVSSMGGNELASHAYQKFWRTQVAFPVTTLADSVRQAFRWDDSMLCLNLAVLLLVYSLAFLKRLRLEYTLYALATLCLFLSKKTDPLLQSTMRYLLAVFPAHAALGCLLRSRAGYILGATLLLLLNLRLLLHFFEWSLVL